MTPKEFEALKHESTQELRDIIHGLASVMNQRYYILDAYATELLDALKGGDETKIKKAKDDLAQFLKKGY